MRALTVVLLLLSCPVLFAQATEGTILGNLTDQTGAAMANALVVVTNTGTGVSRETRTNEAGEYVVTNLPLGTYSVTAEAKGFKRAVQAAVPITVKARVRVDMALEVGETTQRIEVSSAAPLVKTDTAEVGGVVSRQVLQDVPVFGRNFLALAALVPGTTNGPPASRQRDFSGASVTISGASAEANNFIIDGISNNMEFSGALGVVPAIDAIQEFAIQTSQYSAEFGRSGGGVVNVAIKSGTNDLHGFAYDYLRNDKLDARVFDFTGTNPAKQPLRRNQFGGGLGGPIIRNRVFGFGNYEGIRNPSSNIAQYIMPSAAERRGDFSGSSIIYADPATVRPDPSNALGIRLPHPNNQVPASRLDPMTTRLLSFFPEPNFRDPNPNVRNNYLISERNNDRLNSFNFKGDANLNERNTVTGRISQQRGGRRRSFWMPNDRLGAKASLDGTNTGLTFTRVVRPTLINEVRLGYNYLRFGNEMLNNENIFDEFNIPGWNTVPFAKWFPTFSIRNYTGTSIIRPIASVPTPFFLVEHSWQLMENVSWQRGKHAFKFGGEVDRIANNRFQGRNGGGSLSYDGTYSTPVVGAALEPLRVGMTDALLGQARAFSTNYQFDGVRIRSTRFGAFFQDDYRATSKLTLNLGLRYDFYKPWTEEQDRLANFDLATGQRVLPESTRRIVRDLVGIPNGDLPPATWRYTTLDQIIPRKNWTNFAPRFGFAYNTNRKIVVRGGYGLFYAVTVSNNFNNAGTEGNPFFFDFSLASELDRPIIPRQGFPAGGAVGALAARTFGGYYGPLDRPDPYTQKWSLNVQWNPLPRTAIEVGYTGQRALHASTLAPGNTPPPGPGAVQDRRPYPNIGFWWQFLPINDSNYNGLEITFKQQPVRGFSFQSAFTFSKALAYSTGTDGTLSDAYNFRYDYGPANYDFRKRWVSAFIYRLPGPKASALARHVLGGWETSGLITLQGGFPYFVGVTGPILNNGAGTNRANLIRNPNLGSGATRERWFDTSAFTAPPNFVWGAQGKNTLRAPGLAQVDFAVQKVIPVTESKRFTVRMESQNFFNRVQLGQPTSTLGAPNFGVIRSLQAGPRNIQMVGRFDF